MAYFSLHSFTAGVLRTARYGMRHVLVDQSSIIHRTVAKHSLNCKQQTSVLIQLQFPLRRSSHLTVSLHGQTHFLILHHR